MFNPSCFIFLIFLSSKVYSSPHLKFYESSENSDEQHFAGFSNLESEDLQFNSNSNATGSSLSKTYPELELEPVRKYGEEPTDRVLPVDFLTEEDYEDEDVVNNEISEMDLGTNIQSDDYCAKILRTDIIKVLKKFQSRRSPRQNSQRETDSLSQNYLDFDLGDVISPLLNIMGSAMERNVSGIDQHYRRLPPLLKTEITDFLSVFTELIKIG